jgi:two-component system, NtrC family, sensor kinase
VFELQRFSLADMTRCGIALRRLGADADSMEEVANRIVQMLHRELMVSGSDTNADARACALVRTFVTLPYAELEPDLQAFARRVVPDEVHETAVNS